MLSSQVSLTLRSTTVVTYNKLIEVDDPFKYSSKLVCFLVNQLDLSATPLINSTANMLIWILVDYMCFRSKMKLF